MKCLWSFAERLSGALPFGFAPERAGISSGRHDWLSMGTRDAERPMLLMNGATGAVRRSVAKYRRKKFSELRLFGHLEGNTTAIHDGLHADLDRVFLWAIAFLTRHDV